MMVFYQAYLLEFILVLKHLGYQRLSLVKIFVYCTNKIRHDGIYLGIVCALFAAVFPLAILGEMTSIGTLVAFFLVHLAVIIVNLHE